MREWGEECFEALKIMAMAMMLALTFYKIDRADHEENLRQLATRKAAT